MKISTLTICTLLLAGIGNAQTITNYTTLDGLLHDNVLCVDTDASDNAWFGTQAGVSVFDGVSWTSHTTATDAGLADNTIQAIYVANSGDVWVGTDFGASVYSGGSWTKYTTVDGLGDNQIKCITEDASGNIWFGTNSGASKFDGVSTWQNFGTGQGLPFGGVNSIDVHANGDVWMGTGLSGVYIYNGSSFTSIGVTQGLLDNRIREMVIDGSNYKWVGTSEGLSVLNSANAVVANHTRPYTLPAPDTLNPIEDVEMDSQENIWIGVYVDYLVTEGGVCAYNGFDWVEYHVSDGLVGPVIRALAVNSIDEVWVATSTGVSLINDPTVGFTDLTVDNDISVYPVPSNDKVYFKMKSENFEVRIFDAFGREIEILLAEYGKAMFNGNGLAKGTYVYQILANNEIVKMDKIVFF